jgi:cell division protein ZipA
MQIDWRLIELGMAVLVIFTIFYIIIRYNRHSAFAPDEIIPAIGGADVDALMTETVSEKKSPISDDVIGEVRVLSAEEAQKRLEMMQNKSYASKSTLNTFKPSAQSKYKVEKFDSNDTLIVMYVMAKSDAAFSGYDLYHVLTAAGLTYGEMKIFHRYAEKSERTHQVLFSVASAVKPGFISLEEIGGFSTKGLSLFMDFSKQKTASATFQLMLNAAKQLADELDGVLLDAHRQPWNLISENACRRKIQQYNMHFAAARQSEIIGE